MESEQDTNPYESPTAAQADTPASIAETEPSYGQGKRRQLLWMIVVFAVNGFLTGALPNETAAPHPVNIVAGILFALLILRWYDYDRRERRIARWRYFAFLMVICPGPLIMVPIYLCVTRGARGIFATLKAAVFLVLLIGVEAAAAMARMYLAYGSRGLSI